MSTVHVVVESIGTSGEDFSSSVVAVYGDWYEALEKARVAHRAQVDYWRKEWVDDGETEPFDPAKCEWLGHYLVSLWEDNKRIKTQEVRS